MFLLNHVNTHTHTHFFISPSPPPIQWAYNEFISIVPNTKATNNQEFLISMKKGAKKTDSMKFSTDHRADLLTEALV